MRNMFVRRKARNGNVPVLDLLEEALPKIHPRSELDALVPEINEMFKDFDRFEIVGSYRRGKSDFKDIDLLVQATPQEFSKVEDILQETNLSWSCGVIIPKLSLGFLFQGLLGGIPQ